MLCRAVLCCAVLESKGIHGTSSHSYWIGKQCSSAVATITCADYRQGSAETSRHMLRAKDLLTRKQYDGKDLNREMAVFRVVVAVQVDVQVCICLLAVLFVMQSATRPRGLDPDPH